MASSEIDRKRAEKLQHDRELLGESTGTERDFAKMDGFNKKKRTGKLLGGGSKAGQDALDALEQE